ncbi:TPA: hypothetical protein SIA31_000013 [Aeromonas sobria]|nr:hypothetical protein [Aeromonas sobria]
MENYKVIQHELALNENGKTIPISLAVRNVKYYCRGCGALMVPRLGEINQHHYAHMSKCVAGYNPETEAHYNTKIAISKISPERLELLLYKYTNNRSPVTVDSIKVECGIDGYVADVRVNDTALEVTNTHYSTKQKLVDLRHRIIDKPVDDWDRTIKSLNKLPDNFITKKVGQYRECCANWLSLRNQSVDMLAALIAGRQQRDRAKGKTYDYNKFSVCYKAIRESKRRDNKQVFFMLMYGLWLRFRNDSHTPEMFKHDPLYDRIENAYAAVIETDKIDPDVLTLWDRPVYPVWGLTAQH